jgi:hypothetical protein
VQTTNALAELSELVALWSHLPAPVRSALIQLARSATAGQVTVPANCAHDSSVSRTQPKEVVLSTRAAEAGSGH